MPMRLSPEVSPAPLDHLQKLIKDGIARTARRNHANLAGPNFYGDKLANLRTEAVLALNHAEEIYLNLKN
jgi:hypothetical protein